LFEDKDRQLLKTVLISLLALVIGTVYVIYYDELNGGDPYTARVHVRYVAAILPVLMSYTLSPALNGKRMNTKLFILLAFSFVCLIRWDGQALISGNNYPVDAMLLTAATTQTSEFNGRLLWPIAAMVFLLFMAYRLIRFGFGAWERRALYIFLAFAFVLNGILSFALNRYHNESTMPEEAREAVALAGTKGTLGVVRDGACFWPEAAELDVASRCTLPVVELDDLIGHANPDGSLARFTPKQYWQENAVYSIQAPDSLILTNDILNSIILTNDSRAAAVSTTSGGYCVLPVIKGRPVLHSGLSGLNQGWVQPGSRFTLFDKTLRGQGSIKLSLQARAGEGQAQLTLHCGSQEQTFLLTDSLQWIKAAFAVEDPNNALTVTLQNTNGNVFIQTYLVE
jgi:FtsH-binding integral membrane protein